MQKHVAGRQGFTLKKESYKAYQEPELHVKHIWSDFQNCFFFFSFSCSSVGVGHQNVTYLQLYRNAGACLVPILFAEGNPGKVQLLLRADTSSIWQGVFEWMAEGEFASKFDAFTEDLNFLWISLGLDQGITFSIQVGQKYFIDETFLAISVLAALSCILVSE